MNNTFLFCWRLAQSIIAYLFLSSQLQYGVTVKVLLLVHNKFTQAEVLDGRSKCPEPDERTTGVSCVQIYIVRKHGRTHESLDMNARKV